MDIRLMRAGRRHRAEEAELAAAAKKAPAKKAAPPPAKKVTAAQQKSATAGSIPDFDDILDNTNADEGIASYSGTGLDDALDALELATSKTDKASIGSKAAIAVDTHPERRFKAAFEAYKEKELPEVRQSHPGLRLQQYHDLLYKQFQKR